MSDIDDAVKEWLRDEYAKRYRKSRNAVEILSVDKAWECDCWSEFTRDDNFIFRALVRMDGVEQDWEYGYWADLPHFIHELDEYINGDRNCPYEED